MLLDRSRFSVMKAQKGFGVASIEYEGERKRKGGRRKEKEDFIRD